MRIEDATFISLGDILNTDTFREIDLYKEYKPVQKKSCPLCGGHGQEVVLTSQKPEVFTVFELKKDKNVFGYIKRTVAVDREFCGLFADRRFNQNIHLIEWDDRFLVCFNDGMYISANYRFVTKNEVFAFLKELEARKVA